MARPSTGSVELHGDHWDIRITKPNGERSKRACLPPGLSKELARAEAARLTKLAARLGPETQATQAEGETLDTFGARWLATRRDSKEGSEHLRKHILPVLGGLRPIASITTRDIERFVGHLDEQVRAGQIAWKTAYNVWGTVTKLFDDACHAKRLELRVLDGRESPAGKVRGPDRGEEKQSAWLFPREATALLASSTIPIRWRHLYALALYTGLRQGELSVLHVADVLLEAGYISVHKAKDRVTGGIKSTKGRKARRVPIEPTLRPLLESLTEGREPAEPLLDAPPKQKVAEELRMHLRRAGLTREELFADDEHRRPLTFHDLRHTFATWLALRGETELVIQGRLGHTDAKMTQKYIEAAEAVGHGDVGQPFEPLAGLGVLPNVLPRVPGFDEKPGRCWRGGRDSNPRPPA